MVRVVGIVRVVRIVRVVPVVRMGWVVTVVGITTVAWIVTAALSCDVPINFAEVPASLATPDPKCPTQI